MTIEFKFDKNRWIWAESFAKEGEAFDKGWWGELNTYNPQMQHNLLKLFTRSKGQHLFVNAQDRFETRSAKESQKLSSAERTSQEKKVADLIKRTLTQLNAKSIEQNYTLKNCCENSQYNTRQALHETFYRGTLSRLPSRLFDRNLLNQKGLAPLLITPDRMRIALSVGENYRFYDLKPFKDEPHPHSDPLLNIDLPSQTWAQDFLTLISQPPLKKLTSQDIATLQEFSTYFEGHFKDLSNEQRLAYRYLLQFLFSEQGVFKEVKKRLFGKKETQLKAGSLLHCYSLPPSSFCLQFKTGEKQYKYLVVSGEHYHKYIQHLISVKHPHSPLIALNFGADSYEQAYNFYRLLKRKRGEKLTLNQGRLQRVSGLLGRVRHLWNRDPQAVSTRISQVVKQIESHIRLDDFVEPSHKMLMKEYLSRSFMHGGTLSRLSTKVFDRGSIKEAEKDSKGDTLEEWLCPELQKKRAALIQHLITLNATLAAASNLQSNTLYQKQRQEMQSALCDLVFTEFQLAKHLGMPMERVSGGSSASHYGLDRYGQRLFIFKRDDAGPHGTKNDRYSAYFKSFFYHGPKSLRGNTESTSEFMAARFDWPLSFNDSPPTIIQNIPISQFKNSQFKKNALQRGSLQLYVDNTQSLGAHLRISSYMSSLPRSFSRKYLYRQDRLVALHRFVPKKWLAKVGLVDISPLVPQNLVLNALLKDQIIGNNDGHPGNYLIKKRTLSFENSPFPMVRPLPPTEESLLIEKERAAEVTEEMRESEDPPERESQTTQPPLPSLQTEDLEKMKQRIHTFFSTSTGSGQSSYQDLLEELFPCEEANVWDEEKKDFIPATLSLISIDKGSSFRSKNLEGFLEKRFTNYLELFLTPETKFPSHIKHNLDRQESQFDTFISTLVLRNLEDCLENRGIYEQLLARKEIESWVEAIKEGEETGKVRSEIQAFIVGQKLAHIGGGNWFDTKFVERLTQRHLERIEGIVRTRYQAATLLKDSLERKEPVQKLLRRYTAKKVRSRLAKIKDSKVSSAPL